MAWAPSRKCALRRGIRPWALSGESRRAMEPCLYDSFTATQPEWEAPIFIGAPRIWRQAEEYEYFATGRSAHSAALKRARGILGAYVSYAGRTPGIHSIRSSLFISSARHRHGRPEMMRSEAATLHRAAPPRRADGGRPGGITPDGFPSPFLREPRISY